MIRHGMLSRLHWFLIVSVLATTVAASPIESEVEVAPGVPGTFAAPPGEGAAGSPVGNVVVLLHGWTGNRDDAGGLFKDLAARLADQGTASLRIDFRGEGERNGHRLTSTFATRIADAEAALAFARKRYPSAKLGVVGFSLGGAAALAVVGRQPDAVKSLVLWSTAGDIAVDFFTTEDMKPAVRQAMEKGEAPYQSWAPMTLTREHLTGFLGYDLFGPLSAYHGALLGIRGTDDFLPRYEDRILAAAGAAPEEAVVIGGADHIYNVLDPKTSRAERLLTLTARWFADTL